MAAIPVGPGPSWPRVHLRVPFQGIPHKIISAELSVSLYTLKLAAVNKNYSFFALHQTILLYMFKVLINILGTKRSPLQQVLFVPTFDCLVSTFVCFTLNLSPLLTHLGRSSHPHCGVLFRLKHLGLFTNVFSINPEFKTAEN